MFELDIDDRISSWATLRNNLNNSLDPIRDIWEFWKSAPFIPHNKKIDPFYQRSWPTPWQIIVDNQYDDFTKALMIGWTIKLFDKFKDSKVEIRIFVDKKKNTVYNIVVIDEDIAINYNDDGPVKLDQIPDNISIENFVELDRPR